MSWANTIQAIPLFAGGVDSKAIPGPFRGAAGGELKKPITLDCLVDQLERDLKWRQNNNNWAQNKRYDLAGYAEQKIFPQALKNKRRSDALCRVELEACNMVSMGEGGG